MSDDFSELAQALGCVDPSWEELFNEQHSNLQRIFESLSGLILRDKLAPKITNVFRAFEISVSDVKVVILGQDPYPTPGLAIGRAFAIDADCQMPASLKNIEKELHLSYQTNSSLDQTLQSWADQGVFLLNTSLTLNVEDKSHGHFELWNQFTCAALSFLAQHKHPQVWMLWGNKAAEYADLAHPHKVLTTSHPSPLSAHRGFSGSGIFLKCNTLLESSGIEPIQWLPE